LLPGNPPHGGLIIAVDSNCAVPQFVQTSLQEAFVSRQGPKSGRVRHRGTQGILQPLVGEIDRFAEKYFWRWGVQSHLD
jgi:hypothetical protein